MDERLKDIMENFENLQIGVDDSFKFHCTMCSSCCYHREDVLLNPKDVYNISKELGLTPQETIDQYCETYIGGDSRMPIVRLKPRGSVQRCPLLKNHKCSVHKAKPAVCAMFPVGRCLKMDEKEVKDITTDDILYIFQNPGCGDNKETHTVREWLESFGMSVKDEYFIEWQKTVAELCLIFRKAEKMLSQETMEKVWVSAYVALYLHYDMNTDFMDQFEENSQKILELMHKVFRTATSPENV